MPLQLLRIRAVGSLMGLALLVLVGRLWWLQLAHWYRYSARALDNRTTVVYKSAPRGLIYDRRGEHILAENRDVWTVHIVPGAVPEDDAGLESMVLLLAGILSTEDAPASAAELRAAIKGARTAKTVEPVPLGELGQDLTFDQVASIEEHSYELPGVVVVTSTTRHYPYGRLAAQTVGYARKISREKLRELEGYQHPRDPRDPTAPELGTVDPDPIYRGDAIVGAEGAEALCEMDKTEESVTPILPGRDGRTIYEVDAGGTPQRLISKREPERGADVYLTLDAKVQSVAERALREALVGNPQRMGAAVVMDTRDGEVIALATEPSLDPNDWVGGLSQEQWQQALNAPGLPLLNKAISGTYPPGSIFKVVSSCAGLETTKATRHTTAYCTGRIYVGRKHRKYECWIADQGGHGQVDFAAAVAKSCNIWFYNLVLRWGLDPNDISLYAHRFGLGEVTGLGLNGERPGFLPEPEYSDRAWTQGNSLNYVIGQELTVTPVQMCAAACAVANGGTLPQPTLVRRIRWPGYTHRKQSTLPAAASRPVKLSSKETLALVRDGMRKAVNMDRGTAHSLLPLQNLYQTLEQKSPPIAGASNSRPLLIAAKTGTAQHDPRKENHAWCIAFAPYDVREGEPQYAICVFVAEGGTGAHTSVPIAGRILRALFGLHAPDDKAYALPAPMGPGEVAQQRRARIQDAKRWVAKHVPKQPKGPSGPPAR